MYTCSHCHNPMPLDDVLTLPKEIPEPDEPDLSCMGCAYERYHLRRDRLPWQVRAQLVEVLNAVHPYGAPFNDNGITGCDTGLDDYFDFLYGAR